MVKSNRFLSNISNRVTILKGYTSFFNTSMVFEKSGIIQNFASKAKNNDTVYIFLPGKASEINFQKCQEISQVSFSLSIDFFRPLKRKDCGSIHLFHEKRHISKSIGITRD